MSEITPEKIIAECTLEDYIINESDDVNEDKTISFEEFEKNILNKKRKKQTGGRGLQKVKPEHKADILHYRSCKVSYHAIAELMNMKYRDQGLKMGRVLISKICKNPELY